MSNMMRDGQRMPQTKDENLAYMTDTYEEAEDITAAIGDRYGFGDDFDWPNVYRAIDVDHSGYATGEQARALSQRIGGADPHRG